MNIMYFKMKEIFTHTHSLSPPCPTCGDVFQLNACVKFRISLQWSSCRFAIIVNIYINT